MKNTTFFERILQVIEFYNIKSINSFAKDYLSYESSEKINRLKDEKKKPSFEILDDISNKFEDVDMNWLVSGKGEMLKNNQKIGNVDNSNVVGANVNGTGININGASSELVDVIKKQQEQIDKLIEVINKLSDK